MVCSLDQTKKQRISLTMTGKTDQQQGTASSSRLRLNLRQLEVFVATAREGSTRAAACSAPPSSCR